MTTLSELRWSALRAAVLLALLGGCRGRDAGVVAFDFVGGFDLATADREAVRIVFGTPEGRAHLAEGFSVDEHTSNGRPFAWSEGGQSSLDFFLTQPRPVRLRFRCAPLSRPRSSPQTVAVAVNGHRLTVLPLAPAERAYEVRVPADSLVGGTNRLTLRYGHTESAGAADRRQLAVAWFEMGLEPLDGTGVDAPDAETGSGLLRIPAGAQLSYYLRLPADSSLTAEALELRSPGGVALAVLVQPDGEPERERARLTRSSSPWRLSLADDSGKLVRISFRALGRPGATGSAAVRLSRLCLRAGAHTAAAPASPPPPERGRRPHVFIYLVDTLRADHLGCYGYGRPVSPHVDAFAKAGTRYHAIAPSSWTKASVASLFTSRSPIVHRAEDRGDTLAPEAVTLSELLGEAGYRTYALYANSWVSSTFGVDQGFEERRFRFGRSDRLNRELFARLGRMASGERLFAYVHTVDPHAPYEPTPEFRARFAPRGAALRRFSIESLGDLAARRQRGETIPRGLIDEIEGLYDAEIAFNDLQFGRFLEQLRRRGLYDDSLIVFTSDHGEEFFDHGGVSHGKTLFSEVLEVPLIVKWPRGIEPPPGANGSTAQLLDVLPTVLDCAGLPAPAGIEGRSLLQPPPADPAPAGRGAASYLNLDGELDQSVTEGPWKLIRHGALDDPRSRLALYETGNGREGDDVHDAHPVMTGLLAAQISAAVARRPRTPPPPQAVLPQDVIEQLRALGYMR